MKILLSQGQMTKILFALKHQRNNKRNKIRERERQEIVRKERSEKKTKEK